MVPGEPPVFEPHDRFLEPDRTFIVPHDRDEFFEPGEQRFFVPEQPRIIAPGERQEFFEPNEDD